MATRRVTTTIIDDDPVPTVSVPDVELSEGSKSHPGVAYVVVSLSNPSSSVTKIAYSTEDVTAIAGVDYKAARGTLPIKAGAVSGKVTVRFKYDSSAEGDEVFDVFLAGFGTSIVPAGTFSRVVIVNDTVAGLVRPAISISDPTVVEGTAADFDVTLSAPTANAVSFRYSTVADTASSADFTATSGILSIPAGSTSAVIAVPTLVHASIATGEMFLLNVSTPANGVLASTSATATLAISTTTTSTLPGISISNITTTEGTTGTTTASFFVTLSQASTDVVTVDYATADGTAIAGTNYEAASGTVTFTAGQTSQTIPVTIDSDTTAGADETFTLNLNNPVNATITTAGATGTIINDNVSHTSVDLSDNLSDATTDVETATGTNLLAANFGTSTSAVTLTQVTLLLANTITGTVTVQIYSDGGLQPGSLVGTLTSPTTYSSAAPQTTFTSSGIALAANTTYWVVLTANSGSFDWSWTSVNTGTGAGFQGQWGNSSDSGSTWYTDDNYPLQMSVLVD